MSKPQGIKIDLYCDHADIAQMRELYQKGLVQGFTTNPSLLRKAGVSDYESYAREVLAELSGVPISFELLSDDYEQMYAEAMTIRSWGGSDIFIKVPAVNTRGEDCMRLIEKLSGEGCQLNVTLIFTEEQSRAVAQAISPKAPSIISVFAGRIADTGVDPMPLMRKTVELFQEHPEAKVLWASTREVINIFQAEECGCHIITAPPSVLNNLHLLGKDLHEYSVEGAQVFAKDAQASELSLV